MKTRSNFILILAAVAVIACSKESKVEFSKVQTFTATLETPTKTTLVPGDDDKLTKMEFKAGDAIGIFDQNGKLYKFTTAKGGSSASFTGEVEVESPTWYALYPYREDAKIDTSSPSKELSTILPEVQFAVKDNIPSNVSILIASCSNEDKSLKFGHRAGYIKLNVPDGCVSVTLETLTKTPLSGGYCMKYSANSSWSTQFRYNSVTLVAPDGGTMSEGTYYMAVLPIDYTGDVLLTMRHKDGRISVKKATGLKVGQGQIKPINVTPVWMEDDGLRLYTEEAGNQCYLGCNSPVSTVEDVTDVKLLGSKSTKWTISAGNQGYFQIRFKDEKGESRMQDLSAYKEGYALEYYVQAVPKYIKDWEFYRHNYVYSSDSRAQYGSKYLYGSTYGGGDTYLGINDNEWHRISEPLTRIADIDADKIWRIEFETKGGALETGNVLYFDDFRIVRKTPTSTPTE